MIDLLNLTNLALISLIWTIPLKGVSMWLSAKRDQKIWFVFLLIINTMGIVELVYLLLYGIPGKKGFKPLLKESKPVKKSKPKKK